MAASLRQPNSSLWTLSAREGVAWAGHHGGAAAACPVDVVRRTAVVTDTSKPPCPLHDRTGLPAPPSKAHAPQHRPPPSRNRHQRTCKVHHLVLAPPQRHRLDPGVLVPLLPVCPGPAVLGCLRLAALLGGSKLRRRGKTQRSSCGVCFGVGRCWECWGEGDVGGGVGARPLRRPFKPECRAEVGPAGSPAAHAIAPLRRRTGLSCRESLKSDFSGSMVSLSDCRGAAVGVGASVLWPGAGQQARTSSAASSTGPVPSISDKFGVLELNGHSWALQGRQNRERSWA